MTRRDFVSIGATLALMGLFFFSVWLVLNPAHPIWRHLHAEISDPNAQLIVGPYPSEDDFRRLKANGVTLIVSLLDPSIPYETILLDRERELAAQMGMRFLDFPMASILGVGFGKDYDKNAAAAAAAVADEINNKHGKVFLHCYLGIHRVKSVEDLLQPQQIASSKYRIREGERTPDEALLDQAQASFEHAHYGEALAFLEQIPQRDGAAETLYGWSSLKLGQIQSAKTHFLEAVKLDPGNADARVGIGYAALRENDLQTANEEFSKIPESARDGQALVGLAIVQFRQGRLAEAETLLHAALLKDPGNADAQALLARISGGKKKTISSEN